MDKEFENRFDTPQLPGGVSVTSPVIFPEVTCEINGIVAVQREDGHQFVQVRAVVGEQPLTLTLEAVDFAQLVLTGCEQMASLGFHGFNVMWNMAQRFAGQKGFTLRTEPVLAGHGPVVVE